MAIEDIIDPELEDFLKEQVDGPDTALKYWIVYWLEYVERGNPKVFEIVKFNNKYYPDWVTHRLLDNNLLTRIKDASLAAQGIPDEEIRNTYINGISMLITNAIDYDIKMEGEYGDNAKAFFDIVIEHAEEIKEMCKKDNEKENTMSVNRHEDNRTGKDDFKSEYTQETIDDVNDILKNTFKDTFKTANEDANNTTNDKKENDMNENTTKKDNKEEDEKMSLTKKFLIGGAIIGGVVGAAYAYTRLRD